MSGTFTFHLDSGPQTFTFRRQKASMAVAAIYEKHRALFDEFEALQEDGNALTEKRAIRLLMSNEDFFESFMRLHLKGDHATVDWFYEADPKEVMAFLQAYSAWANEADAEPPAPTLVDDSAGKPRQTKNRKK